MPTGAQEVTKNRTSNNNNPINILFVSYKLILKCFYPLSDINLKHMKNVKIFPFGVLSKLCRIILKRSGYNTKRGNY